jgi:hypothetical protein
VNQQILSVACGHCTKISRVQPTGTGDLVFQCPSCHNRNRINISAGGEVKDKLTVDLPDWWKHKPEFGKSELSPVSATVLAAIQRLFDETWKPITTRDREYGTVNKLTVIQVQHNANPKLWQNYACAREKVRNRVHMPKDRVDAKTGAILKDINENSGKSKPVLGRLDDSVNEFLIFHGTKPSACESICQSDFMVNLAGSHAGSLYGPGIYFGENSSKSDEYASDDASGIYKGLYAMLLCRVTCGRMFYTSDVAPEKQMLVEKCTSADARFHSVLGDREKARGTYREFVLFNNDLAYPEYIIIYRRETDKDDEAE